MYIEVYPWLLLSVSTHPPSDRQEVLWLYLIFSKWFRFSGEDCKRPTPHCKNLRISHNILDESSSSQDFWNAYLRDLLPFILPQLNPDAIDDMGAVNNDIFPSGSLGNNSRPLYPLGEHKVV